MHNTIFACTILCASKIVQISHTYKKSCLVLMHAKQMTLCINKLVPLVVGICNTMLPSNPKAFDAQLKMVMHKFSWHAKF
jgi:hypothetical protein